MSEEHMKLFIWDRLGSVSSSYHTEGGLVIAATNLDHANELVAHDKWIEIDRPPTRVLHIEPVEPFYTVFPDAGCC